MPAIPDRHLLHEERPLREAPAADFVELAHAAGDGQLSLYVGAGISVQTPTLLPASRELLERLAPIVERELGIVFTPGEPTEDVHGSDAQATLERLADMAEEAAALAPFREIAASASNFRGAPAGYSHRAIAALLREGAVTVFCVNWDRCIEFGAAEIGFYVDVTITEADRAVRFASCRYHKIHGCATQPATLLISTRELETPLKDPGKVGGSDVRICPGGRRCSCDVQTEEVLR